MKLFIFLVILFAQFTFGLEGKVVGVHDGDTITVLDISKTRHKIRLAKIDAPELDQAWGKNSKKTLSDLIFNRFVLIEVETIDQYGREVGTVFFDKIDICKEQVKQGNAWVYTQYSHDKGLVSLEDSARSHGLGLWSTSGATAPWLWRKTKKSSSNK
jgi:micrococcal nuclease